MVYTRGESGYFILFQCCWSALFCSVKYTTFDDNCESKEQLHQQPQAVQSSLTPACVSTTSVLVNLHAVLSAWQLCETRKLPSSVPGGRRSRLFVPPFFLPRSEYASVGASVPPLEDLSPLIKVLYIALKRLENVLRTRLIMRTRNEFKWPHSSFKRKHS